MPKGLYLIIKPGLKQNSLVCILLKPRFLYHDPQTKIIDSFTLQHG